MHFRSDYPKLLWVEMLMFVVLSLMLQQGIAAGSVTDRVMLKAPSVQDRAKLSGTSGTVTHHLRGELTHANGASTRDFVVQVPLALFQQLEGAHSIVIVGETP